MANPATFLILKTSCPIFGLFVRLLIFTTNARPVLEVVIPSISTKGVKSGCVQIAGEVITTTCGVQPVAVAVMITSVPIGIPVIAPELTLPALAVIVDPFGFETNTE